MNSDLIVVFLSLLSFLISLVAYYKPRKVGGSVQWDLDIQENTRSVYLKNIGSHAARHVSVTLESSQSTSTYRKLSHPNDIFVLSFFRSIGNPTVTIQINWRTKLLFQKSRTFTF